MSENTFDIFEDDDDDLGSDLPKKLRKQIKILQQERDALAEENTVLKGSERKRTITASLQSKGLNPKISAFVPQDLSEEEIDTWLEEYGDVFGVATPEASDAPVIARDAEHAAALRSMAAAEKGAAPAASVDLLSQIEGAEDMASLMQILGR
jgi:uncharacterized protein YdaT